jgi:Histone methylation protein DOT1
MSIFNTSAKEIQYRVKVTELRDHDMLPVTLRDRYLAFSEIFNRDDAQQVSQKDRVAKNVSDKIEFTYGEVLFPYFIPLLDLAKPQSGETFWDLGCGAARPLAIAALNFPQLKKCCGVELLDGLFELA